MTNSLYIHKKVAPMDDAEFWDLEERFWRGGADFYARHISKHGVMAFSQMGILTMDQVLSSVENAPRWESVSFSDPVLTRPSDDLIVLGYLAKGRRGGEPPYNCLCSSAYAKIDDRWRLIHHHQSPVEQEG